ncbi:MAG: acetyl-CoA carboxylase biotin carboxyl carrier protein subunit [Pseudolabrys sp.]|nr:acetyl-CoA carboxylase biotin carboxyl carrier protein subunit [Pseudolabrys sp.]
MARQEVLSPVTGVVFELAVKVGDTVAQGDPIVIVESMKMEIPIVAPCAGRVAEIAIEAGQPVDESQVVAIIDS